MDKKFILIIDAVVLLGSLLSAFFVVGYTQPLVIAPLNGGENSLMFTLPKVDYLLIDENLKFNSPKTVFIEDNLDLEPGRYYIKIDSGLSSEIRELKVETDIVLQLRKLDEDSVGVFNVGESALSIKAYEVGMLVNSSLINVGSSSGDGGRG